MTGRGKNPADAKLCIKNSHDARFILAYSTQIKLQRRDIVRERIAREDMILNSIIISSPMTFQFLSQAVLTVVSTAIIGRCVKLTISPLRSPFSAFHKRVGTRAVRQITDG